jgi:deoxyguanosine kinase
MPHDTRPSLRHLRHIVVEGPIGVGKTSLALRLARALDAETLLEQSAENPFLERFYADREGYAFQAQLFFLFQRVRQVRELAQPGMFVPTVVSDFMFAKDAIFAKLNLSDEEFHHYALMYGRLAPQLPQPDLVIWLQASPQTLLARIRRRGIAMEQRIDAAYLDALCGAYAEHFRVHDGRPLLTVDSERFHPAVNDDDLARLVERLQGLNEGRADLDPSSRPAIDS